MQPVFITGIGTDVGKTVAAAIITEALEADYWKPVQAGFSEGTDSKQVLSLLSNKSSRVAPESYLLKMPASPHIAAREENIEISVEKITADFNRFDPARPIVIEGAGGLMVPLNDRDKVCDLIKALHAKVILVSRNYLGSINHSLLTAEACRQQGIEVAGWIFNGSYLNYEKEIVAWSGYPAIANIPQAEKIDKGFIDRQATMIRNRLKELVC